MRSSLERPRVRGTAWRHEREREHRPLRRTARTILTHSSGWRRAAPRRHPRHRRRRGGGSGKDHALVKEVRWGCLPVFPQQSASRYDCGLTLGFLTSVPILYAYCGKSQHRPLPSLTSIDVPAVSPSGIRWVRCTRHHRGGMRTRQRSRPSRTTAPSSSPC